VRRLQIAITIACAGVCVVPALSAQVGHEPQTSPFRDLRERQEVTVFSGYYRAKRDPAGTAPGSGPMVGVNYQWRAGGPAHLTFAVSRVASERHVLDPELPATCTPNPTGNCKLIGTFRWPLYFADAGLAVSLTGSRSFHRLVPELKSGVGLASDFRTRADLGGFAFGTRFAFTWGAGVRWVPGGRYQVRAEFLNHLYSVRYPDAYYLPALDGSRLFTTDQSRSAWLNNPGLTIGLSYLFSK
jgi:hypothetical protein